MSDHKKYEDPIKELYSRPGFICLGPGQLTPEDAQEILRIEDEAMAESKKRLQDKYGSQIEALVSKYRQ